MTEKPIIKSLSLKLNFFSLYKFNIIELTKIVINNIKLVFWASTNDQNNKKINKISLGFDNSLNRNENGIRKIRRANPMPVINWVPSPTLRNTLFVSILKKRKCRKRKTKKQVVIFFNLLM